VNTETGLTSEEAGRRLTQFGPNAVPDTTLNPFRMALEKSATVAMMGGVRFREDLGPDSSGDPAAQKLWMLDLFGVLTITGIQSQAGGFACALLAFTVVGLIVAVVLTVLVRRRLYGAG